MKKMLLIYLIAISLILCSCFNYRDINRILFVTAVLIDVDDDKNIILYTEVFTTTRAAGQQTGSEERMVFKNTARTVHMAARNINLSSNYRLNYTQNKSIIFTERAAKYGLDNFIDIAERDQEFLLRQDLFVYSGSADELMETELIEEKYLGIFLSELVNNAQISPVASQLRFDEFLNNRRMGSRVNVINLIEIDDEQLDKKIAIRGLAVLKDDKLVDKLTKSESIAYNYMEDRYKMGLMELKNPENPDKFITLRTLRSKTKGHLEYQNNKINIKKSINSRASFASAQESFQLTDPDKRKEVELEAQKQIENQCMELFNKYKDKGIDIFNFQRELEIKYPKEAAKNIMENVNIEVEAKVKIEGSPDKFDFEKIPQQ